MLSRVAEAIYWMNRYIERAENYARFLDVNFNLSLELPPDETAQWRPLVETTGDWELFVSLYGEKPTKNNIIHYMGFHPDNPNSIYNSILNVRENARIVRPEITKEIWTQINYLYYFVKDGVKKKYWVKEDLSIFFNEVKKGCQLLYGMYDATITRHDGWHFGRIGQLLERADKTSRVLDVKYHILLPNPGSVGSSIDLIQWVALLKSVSAYNMYRKKYGKLSSENISEFLILDKNFPRAILSCLMQAEQSLYIITGNNNGYKNDAEKQLGMLRSQLEYSDISTIISAGMHEYLDSCQLKLNNVSTSIYETFFSIENYTKKIHY